MLQIAGLLLCSWILILVFYKKDLGVLGFMPTMKRLKYAGILFIVSAFLSSTSFFLRIYLLKETYMVDPSLNLPAVIRECWFQCRTVLTEELLFRGVLLYILIRKAGAVKAVLISSVIFGIVHWFNAGVWGDPMQMITVFAYTFTMGVLLGYAYARTGSILMPFAIHLGWNLVQNYVFPGNSEGNHIFILEATPEPVTISYLAYYILILFPKLSTLLSGYLIVSRHPRVKLP